MWKEYTFLIPTSARTAPSSPQSIWAWAQGIPSNRLCRPSGPASVAAFTIYP